MPKTTSPDTQVAKLIATKVRTNQSLVFISCSFWFAIHRLSSRNNRDLKNERGAVKDFTCSP